MKEDRKLSNQTQGGAAKQTGTLTKKENAVQAVKFLLFSCTAGIIQTVTFTLLTELPARLWQVVLPYGVCYFVALVFSVLYNFTVNRRFTFQSANNVPVAMLKVAGYYCIFTPLSTWWGEALTGAGVNEYLVFVFTMVVNLVTEFLFCRFVVYRNSMNTNDRAQKKGRSL